MPGAGLTISRDDLATLARDVDKLDAALQGRELRLIAGAAIREVVRQHFYEINSDSEHHETAHSLGAASTGFYLAAADATQAPEVEDEGVSVSINHEGIAQRYHGGDIYARPGSALTIPARAEAYGKRAGEFDNLKLIIFPSLDLAALVDKAEEAHEGGVYFWLVQHVHQEPDETVLPKNDEMLDAAMNEARDYADRIWERKAA